MPIQAESTLPMKSSWFILLSAAIFTVLIVGFLTPASATGSCMATVTAQFSNNGRTVAVSSNKVLSNVVLKYCDDSSPRKYENLTGKTWTTTSSKALAGVWIKSGCNESGAGPGYGRFIGNACPAYTPTPSCTPTRTPTRASTRTSTATPTRAPTAALSPTPCDTSSPTATRTATATPTRTSTPIETLTPTRTETPFPTSTPAVSTSTPTFTPTSANTPTRTATATPTSTWTRTPEATWTYTPSSTPTIASTSSTTPTATVSATWTYTPTATPSPTLTPTATPEQMVEVCHREDTGSYTLKIPTTALIEHHAHGDSSGKCSVDCKGLPLGQATVDECGVCGGDSSTCKDCSGAPNGGRTVDACGVCGGDSSTCLGCDGVPNSQKAFDACGVCGGDSSSCRDCSGVPNGGMTIDQCGVCGGANNTCLDCFGIVNGKSTLDACGVCGGDSLTCTTGSGCAGKLDQCGVCNGTNACLDCAGIPNGGSQIDCCGVCGGDGSSCVDKCSFYNVRDEKKKAGKLIRSLRASVIKYSRAELQCARKGRATIARNRITLAEKLSTQSTELLASVIADTLKVCDTIYCQKSSFVDVLGTLKVNAKKLYTLSRTAQYGAASTCRTKAVARSSAAGSHFRNVVSTLGKIPTVQCTN